jgi:hypothetical protein
MIRDPLSICVKTAKIALVSTIIQKLILLHLGASSFLSYLLHIVDLESRGTICGSCLVIVGDEMRIGL